MIGNYESKLSVGDTAWMMNNNRPIIVVVARIIIVSCEIPSVLKNYSVSYVVKPQNKSDSFGQAGTADGFRQIEEAQNILFETKTDLIASL